MTNKQTTGPVMETGCYIDGHHGRYAIDCLLTLVTDLVDPDQLPDDIDDIGDIVGFSLTGSDVDQTITLQTGQSVSLGDAWDIVSDLYDELTGLLPADDEHAWIWHDGELFYWSTSDIDEWSGQ